MNRVSLALLKQNKVEEATVNTRYVLNQLPDAPPDRQFDLSLGAVADELEKNNVQGLPGLCREALEERVVD